MLYTESFPESANDLLQDPAVALSTPDVLYEELIVKLHKDLNVELVICQKRVQDSFKLLLRASSIEVLDKLGGTLMNLLLNAVNVVPLTAPGNIAEHSVFTLDVETPQGGFIKVPTGKVVTLFLESVDPLELKELQSALCSSFKVPGK